MPYPSDPILQARIKELEQKSYPSDPTKQARIKELDFLFNSISGRRINAAFLSLNPDSYAVATRCLQAMLNHNIVYTVQQIAVDAGVANGSWRGAQVQIGRILNAIAANLGLSDELEEFGALYGETVTYHSFAARLVDGDSIHTGLREGDVDEGALLWTLRPNYKLLRIVELNGRLQMVEIFN
jgi:hypothetical protein